ncbi:tenascin-X [Caerostris darwini]|uniref:Tenascin-X n=1 Tax=Caerostris darwini TaxID=1538125 RepID=A0AAV4TDN2_9ARAC|nr:tenascin-X [Caerostris darwini]
MMPRSLTISACFVFLSILAYTKADLNLQESGVNGISRNSQKKENAYLVEENFNKPLKADCKCTGGKCVTENGEKVCKCPPEYGVLDKRSCKACECGEGSNCTFTCTGWLSCKEIKKCICKEGYEEKSGKCVGPCPSKILDRECKGDTAMPRFTLDSHSNVEMQITV